MALPNINITIQNTIYAPPEDGELIYSYSPFFNQKIETDNGFDLDDLTLIANDAEIDINNPVELTSEVSYDESVNLIVNDRINPLKIVNSRFYLTDSTHYKIADRSGNLDTNIYTSSEFKTQSSLIKTVRNITTLDFIGLFSGGSMRVGNYTFYFKLSDVDGNESDFISESGRVVCHIGNVDNPRSIRGGQLDENSDKIIKFKLNNLDLGYDYIHVYYIRNTGDDNNLLTKGYKISDKFKITSSNVEISITGYETHVEIDPSEINIQYTTFTGVKSTENCQNITFAGNVVKNYELYKILEKYSLLITPSISTKENIGNLNYKYIDEFPTSGGEYTNAMNIYYKLGYWDEEIYRFGIVYIMNDYTLSPVFNIRGIKSLSENTQFTNLYIETDIQVGEDNLIIQSPSNNPENSKGVIKIDFNGSTFNGDGEITPIGVKFNFTNNVLSGSTTLGKPGLKDLTKGFFIVRQKRIPTILAQGLGIATSKLAKCPVIKGTFINGDTGATSNSYFAESFLKKINFHPKLGRSLFKVDSVVNNALLCPEASLRTSIYNNLFNSSEFTLKPFKYKSKGYFSNSDTERYHYYLGNLNRNYTPTPSFNTNILLVEPGVELTRTNKYEYCSRAGEPSVSWKHIDPVLGNVEDFSDPTGEIEKINEEFAKLHVPPWIKATDTPQKILSFKWSSTTSKVRGEFNSFLGTDSSNIEFGQTYNIFQKDYHFDNNWKDYYRIRYNDFSPYSPISDRISWNNLQSNITDVFYRGDCYISTYTQRILWNFTDPELPTNTRIVDPWTWFKNYKVKFSRIVVNGTSVMDDGSDSITGYSDKFYYKKVLPLFTYKGLSEEGGDISLGSLVLPDGSGFKKYSEISGSYGSDKMNRPDVNAVAVGHWVTYKICSNINLAMRDLDFSRPDEEALFKRKRGFYPLQAANPLLRLPESTTINLGVSNTTGYKNYFEIPDVPFIKNSFTNRIYYSELLQANSFKNGNRVFKAVNYQDYTLEHGSITKLVEWYGKLIAVMEHGILMIPVNERAMMANEGGESVYINTDNILPKNPRVISNTYGSVWSDSIIKTPRFIYGVDTIGKKIWRTNGEMFENISDIKIQKFLNDNINLLSTDRSSYVGINIIKAHYNAFKQDVIFTFKYGSNEWSLCWSELLEKWITRYSWLPEFSENINNIFYTFANSEILNIQSNNSLFCKIYKHGFAGSLEESNIIKPTTWYGVTHPFELEFVVNSVTGVQKIFNNLKIISNSAEPDSIELEITGDGYDWSSLKNTIYLTGGVDQQSELPSAYYSYLISNPSVKKLPYIWIRDIYDSSIWPSNQSILRDLTLYKNSKTGEKSLRIFQKGMNIKTQGILKGNMQYSEDAWDIQLQPISFKQVYISNSNLAFSNNVEGKIRDKYLKVKVRYNGNDYAIISGIRTYFTLSYA